VKFWDTSALVPLLVSEVSTGRLQAIASKDPTMFVWWGCEVECVSALARLQREGVLDELTVSLALDRLRQLASTWQEVDASDALREAAVRFVRVHPLRAADALQLAAAYLASERRPTSLEVVTLDERLAAAARKEGFVVTGIPLE
jgi:predicted nucleic acid-binding protein